MAYVCSSSTWEAEKPEIPKSQTCCNCSSRAQNLRVLLTLPTKPPQSLLKVRFLQYCFCEEGENAATTAADASGSFISLFFSNCHSDNDFAPSVQEEKQRTLSEFRRSLCLRKLRSSSGLARLGRTRGAERWPRGLVTSSPGAEGDWTYRGLPALRFALVRRAEVPAGLFSDPGVTLCAAARALGLLLLRLCRTV